MYNLINNASPLQTTSKLVLQMIHRIIKVSADHMKCTVTVASSPAHSQLFNPQHAALKSSD